MSNYSSIPHSSPGRLPQNFNRLQATRQQQNMPPLQVGEQELDQDQPSPVSSLSISPIPPPHRDARGRHWPQDPIQRYSTRTTQSVTTPGADNFSEEAAAGGIAKVALGVAAANARESGIEAMRRIQNPGKLFFTPSTSAHTSTASAFLHSKAKPNSMRAFPFLLN